MGAQRVKTAIDVEKLLIWAYQMQRVDEVVSHAAALSTQRRSVKAQSWEGGGGGGGSTDVHPDALTAHNAVIACTHGQPQARGLVIVNARTGSRPDWMPGAKPRLGPVLNGKGQPETILDPVQRRPIACIVRHYLALESIELARVSYLLWAETLCAIAVYLDDTDGLIEHRLKVVDLPAKPWESGLDIATKT
jgi:hypothetical protein